MTNTLTAKFKKNNLRVSQLNKIKTEFTAEEATQVDQVTEILLEAGYDRKEFAFVKGRTNAFQDNGEDVTWVLVKAYSNDDVFIGHNNKPVTLDNNNSIAVSTFLRRFNAAQEIFVGC